MKWLKICIAENDMWRFTLYCNAKGNEQKKKSKLRIRRNTTVLNVTPENSKNFSI